MRLESARNRRPPLRARVRVFYLLFAFGVFHLQSIKNAYFDLRRVAARRDTNRNDPRPHFIHREIDRDVRRHSHIYTKPASQPRELGGFVPPAAAAIARVLPIFFDVLDDFQCHSLVALSNKRSLIGRKKKRVRGCVRGGQTQSKTRELSF